MQDIRQILQNLQNLRLPDYGTGSVPTPIPLVGITLTADRSGNVFIGPSVGVNLPTGEGRAAGVGWTGHQHTPSAEELRQWLSGLAVNAGVVAGVTWASPQQPGNDDPERLGVNIQTPGVSVGWNFYVVNVRELREKWRRWMREKP
jgi:hypothetical protein